jgi:hypothetical protein
MKDNGRELVEAMHRQAVERFREQLLPRVEPSPTIPYTDLPEARPDDVLYLEWNIYRHEVSRLLAEGREGQFILIKGKQIIGIWDTEEEVEAVARERYLRQSCLIHQIRSCEPLLRSPLMFRQCLS